MNKYVISVAKEKRNTAGSKAPADVTEICRKLGYKVFDMPGFPRRKKKPYQKVWLLIVCTHYWRKLERTLDRDSIVVYQHPMYGNRIAEKMISRLRTKKNVKFVALVHDLESLRGGIAGVTKVSASTRAMSDNVLLRKFDAIICHNEHMKKYMIKQGFDPDRLIDLEIFDYLSDARCNGHDIYEKPTIAIAGNLALGKCAYIYKIFENNKNSGLKVNLYGINFDECTVTGDMTYHGSFEPGDLPGRLRGDFGLVWDGNSSETCSGNTGEYLKYNNPHKTSLYLSAGMPVIVWSQAAIADFILQNGVGITVDSLGEIEDKIKEIEPERYLEMRRMAEDVGKRIRDGYYTRKALETAIGSLY